MLRESTVHTLGNSDPVRQRQDLITRRCLFGRASTGIGSAALAWLLQRDAAASAKKSVSVDDAPLPTTAPQFPSYAPRARRVIYLFQSGAPSQMDLFDYKPSLDERRGVELPDSIRMGQRLTGMTATQQSFPVAPSMFPFAQ